MKRPSPPRKFPRFSLGEIVAVLVSTIVVVLLGLSILAQLRADIAGLPGVASEEVPGD